MLMAQAEPSHTINHSVNESFYQPLPVTEHLSLSRRRKITLGLGMGEKKRHESEQNELRAGTCTRAPASPHSSRHIIACATFEFPSWCDVTYKDALSRCKWTLKQGDNNQTQTPVSMQRQTKPHEANYLCFILILGWFGTWNCS